MESHDRKIWFPAKRYGYGWGLPCRWQGWMVLIGYVGLLIGGIRIIDPSANPEAYFGYIAVLSILLFAIVRTKGEKAAWRWGKKKQDI